MKVAAFWQPFVRGYAPLFGLPKQTTTNLSAVIATCYCNLREKEIEKEDINNFSAKKLYHLGWCYEHGDGVDEDKEYAKILYAKAAEKGNFLAGGRLHYLNSLD